MSTGTASFVEVPCPSRDWRGTTVHAGKRVGTLYLHDPSQRSWTIIKHCPHCRAVHKPAGVRDNRIQGA